MFKKAFKILLTALLSFSILGVLSFLFFTIRYNNWLKDEFRQQASLVCVDQIYVEKSPQQIEDEIGEKIKTFTLSDSRTDFVVLTEQEALHTLSSNLESVEPFSIDGICIHPSQGLWKLFLKYRVGKLRLPWVVMNVVKDNRETAELYISDIKVGQMNFPRFVRDRVVRDINMGISDAVIMLNENRFLGRVIENIELLEDRVVFKGSI